MFIDWITVSFHMFSLFFAERVALWVSKEFDGKVPLDQQSRYQLAITNRMIYEKIKKMRKNKGLDFLDDNYKVPVNSTNSAT